MFVFYCSMRRSPWVVSGNARIELHYPGISGSLRDGSMSVRPTRIPDSCRDIGFSAALKPVPSGATAAIFRMLSRYWLRCCLPVWLSHAVFQCSLWYRLFDQSRLVCAGVPIAASMNDFHEWGEQLSPPAPLCRFLLPHRLRVPPLFLPDIH